MPYAFNLTPDPATAQEIERAYAGLAAHGVADPDLVTQYGPCVTILVAGDTTDPETVTALMGMRLAGLSALPVRFTEPCIIHGTPPTLSIRLAPAAALLALHDAIFAELPEGDVHLQYRPAYWQPHLKLCNVREDRIRAEALVRALATTWQPLEGVLDGLEVIQYPPVQSIWQAPLRASR